MSDSRVDFAILAPVPGEHLRSALNDVLPTQPYVSFGSQSFEFFREVDRLRHGAHVPILIYESHEHEPVKKTFKIKWYARYLESTESLEQKRGDEKAHRRPPSTNANPQDNSSGWGVFWRVTGLQQLPEGDQLTIAMLDSYKTGRGWSNKPPEGPTLVVRPPSL